MKQSQLKGDICGETIVLVSYIQVRRSADILAVIEARMARLNFLKHCQPTG